jgi:hypothetical protein
MLTILLAAALFAQTGEAPAISEDGEKFLETIEAIQSQDPIKDFRYEYEGTLQAMGPVAKEGFKVKEGGIVDVYSGTHVQNLDGDVRDESFHRRADHYLHAISQTSLAVRKREGHAVEYEREDNNGPSGIVAVKKSKEASQFGVGSFWNLLLLEQLKGCIADTRNYRTSVIDGELDSRPVKIVNHGLVGMEDSIVMGRYYVDLARGGHVIRRVYYTPEGAVFEQTDVTLASFQVDGKEVWMPVAAESFGYGAFNYKTRRPYFTKKPTTHGKIAVVDGTMAFNTHPGREIFNTDTKLGTPVSDRIRKMSAEFATQKRGVPSTNAESATAKAPTPNRPLVADLSSERNNWLKWLPLVGVLAVGSSLFALWRQRRRS